jgi:hypothetical protein
VLVIVAPAGAAPPRAGTFVPGESLGGVRLGMTKADVRRVWGERHGICRDCPVTTWYFNYGAFEPAGAGVAFDRRGRVAHAFTLWQPRGWRTPEGLVLGAAAAEITLEYGTLTRRQCVGYHALLAPTARAQSVYYVHDEELWGFGLTRRGASPCL